MWCFIFFLHFYCIQSKQIISNTLLDRDSVELYDTNINLTIWIQFRYPLYLDLNVLETIRILDENNSIQLVIQLLYNTKQLELLFILQNKTQSHKNDIKENTTFEWQMIRVERNICFNRLQYLDINMSTTCNKTFNATLYIMQSIYFHVFVYDKEELHDEEIILSNLILMLNMFSINTFKNDLQIKFYCKVYFTYQDELFFSLSILQGFLLNYRFYNDNIIISIQKYQIEFKEQILKVQTTYDQWVLFSIEFDQLVIIIQYNINNQNQLFNLKIDKYLNMSLNQLAYYQFNTESILQNRQTIIIQFLQIISLLQQHPPKSCINCLFCLEKQCFDKQKNFEILNHTKEIYTLKYFYEQNYEQYLTNKQSRCSSEGKFFQNETCFDLPKYNGYNCYNCHILPKKSIPYLIQSILLGFSYIINYEPQLTRFNEIQQSFMLADNGLYYEEDLNIFIMKTKDFYLTYYSFDQIYCEIGYSFSKYWNKCMKIVKNCQLHLSICALCKQQYALVHNKCIRCQKNCLYCKITNKSVNCILFMKNYYQNSQGLIQQCINNSEIFDCLSKDQAINLRGHTMCQQNQFYEFFYCYDFIYYEKANKFFQSNIDMTNYQQNLEIQDKFVTQEYLNDSQIISLISLQQLNKLSQQVKKYQKDQILLEFNTNLEFLSHMNSSLEDINISKVILKDIKIYLEDKAIIIYENMKYNEIIDIYNELPIQFKVVQFDLVFIKQDQLYQQTYSFEIDYENFKNVQFILNITFKTSPSILYLYSNRFHFKAHQVLFGNLNFQYQINDQRKQLDMSVFFKIVSEKIMIHNLLLKDQNLINVFDCQKFIILLIENVQIIGSKIEKFIKAFSIEFDSQLKISHIYANKSTFTDCFSIERITYININTFVNENSTINGFIFNIIGYFYYIHVSNLQFYRVFFKDSTVLYYNQILLQQKQSIILSNLFYSQAQIINSDLFFVSNVQNIQFDQFYLHDIFLQNSTFIQLEKNIYITLENLNIHKLNIEFSLFVNIIGESEIIMNQFYFKKCIFGEEFQFIYASVYYIEAKNFNIQQIDLILTDFIEIYAIIANLTNFILYKFKTYKSLSLEISSLEFLYIQGIILKQNYGNSSQLLQISTSGRSFVKYLFLISLDIFNDDQEQLILFKCGKFDNSIKYLNILQVNVTNQKKDYILIKVINQRNLVIIHLNMKHIQNQLPNNQVYLIQSQLFELIIHHVVIYDISFVNFLKSSSNSLILSIFEILKVYTPCCFIQHTSNFVSYPKETIDIRDFEVRYFGGTFISIQTQTQAQTIFNKLQFQYFIPNFKLFQVISIDQQQSKLHINTLNFNNEIFDESYSSYHVLIETNFVIVKINQIFIKNVYTQIFHIFSRERQDTSLTNIFISILKLNYPIFRFDIELDHLATLRLSNFTIIHSQIWNRSLFELLFSNFKIILEDIKIINVTVDNEIFKFESSQKQLSTIKISNIILKDVTSNQFLFHINPSINFFWISIIGGSTPYIFSSNNNQIGFIYGLITSLQQSCFLSESNLITINQSEIVNGNVMQHYDKLISYNSIFQGMVTNINTQIMMFLSLNNGISIFNLNSIKKNLYQTTFSKNNSYLYLPSGRDVQDYKYFNFATRQYTELYDSISYISLFQTKSTHCILKQSLNNQTIYEQNISILPGVNKIFNLTFTLNPYLKDKFIEFDLICNQNQEQITYRTLIKTFNCQLGEFLFKDQCILCNIDQYSYSVGYNQQNCLIMDQNTIESLKIGQIKLYKSFWRHSYANKYIEQCKNQNCLGGWQPGDQSCQVGYLGAICYECDLHNILGQGNFGKINNQCLLCYYDYSIYLKGLLLIIFQLILVFISYYSNQQQSQQYLFLRISKRKFTDILLRQNVNQVTILLKLYYNYLFTLYLLKDLINFGQFVDFSLNIIYNPSLIAIPQFDCLINQYFQYPTQYALLLQKILVPISILNFIVIIYTFLIKLKLAKYSVYVIIVSLLIIQQQNQQIILQSLIKLLSPVKYSNIYWTQENLSIQYYSKSHQHYLLVLIIPLIAFVTIISIIVFLWIKFINYRIFNNLKLSLFIYKQYKGLFYYWDYFRLLLTYLFMVIVYSQDNTYIIILTIIFQTLTYSNKPFVLQHFNQIDQIILMYSQYTYFGILVHSNDSTSYKYIIIIISNVILLKLFIKQFIHSFNISFRDSKIKLLSLIIKYRPSLIQYINTQIYEKNKYYYKVLKQSRKRSITSLTPIIQNAESKSNPYLSFEVEMTQIHLKQ